MSKEIHEQPSALAATLRVRRGAGGRLVLDDHREAGGDIPAANRVCVTGCGTSLHAGMVARCSLQRFTGLPVAVEIASEFRYQPLPAGPPPVVVAVSQSGETLDTLEAARRGRAGGAPVVAVTNTADSALARGADAVVYTRAGPEIGVAATKTHTTQIVALQLLGLYLGQTTGALPDGERQAALTALERLPALVESTIARWDGYAAVARRLVGTRDFFFLGRGVGYPVALEGALKLKEISYVRAEGYAAGEMRHGPVAMVEPGTVVVGIATESPLRARMLSDLAEMRSRGATVVAVATDGDDVASAAADAVLAVPRLGADAELLCGVVNAVPLQVFAHAFARAMGRDVDNPRHLSKAVTAE